MELSKKFSYISGEHSQSSINKKKTLRKKFLYFGKWNLLALSLKNFLYFKRRELAKPKKQTKKICSEEISCLL